MGKGSNTTSSSSTTVTRPDAQAGALYRNVLDRAQNVASTPYQAYSGPLTAFGNSQQNLGVAGVNANANYASPFIGDAASMARTAASPISASDISNYMNPYTQNVVDATTAQMMRDFGQQNAQLQGNQISQGALGGNATGVAKAILAGQQGRQLASTTAGLYSQGYQQAVDAAQKQQQAGLAGANAIANYGISGQNAALQGANAQWGIGTQQQGISQADYDRMYQQYQQAQAFPYQQTQWLGGIATGVGSNLGGTSTTNGTTTGPAPNSTGQWIGAGLTAASLLSDRRAKTDIEKIGQTNDGQNLYRYRYHGSPDWHIGPMAQEVDPEHRARGGDGLLYVDLKGATDDAVERASGGAVEAPYSSGVAGLGWIPQTGIHAGAGAPSAPGLMSPKDPGSSGTNPEAMAKGIVGAGKALGGLDWSGGWNAGLGNLSGDAWGGGSFFGGDAYGGSSAAPLSEYGLSADDYGPGFAAGGGVMGNPMFVDPNEVNDIDLGLTDPNEVNDLDRAAPDILDPSEVNDIDRAAPPSFGDRFGGDDPSKMETMSPDDIPASVIDRTPGLVNPGAPVRVDGLSYRNNPDAPGPGVGRSIVPAQPPDEEAATVPAPGAAGRTSGPARPPVMAFEDSDHYRRIPDAAPVAPQRRGFGLGLLPDNAATGLMAAGLGMMASRSPFLGNVVGEGGLAGLGTYARAEQSDREAAMEAQKLAREARQTAYKNWSDERKQSETERHNLASEGKEFKPTWGVVDEDPITGRKIYGWIDPNNKTTSRPAAPVGDRATIPAAAVGDDYAKELEQRNPEMARTAKGVAEYRINPATLSQRGGMREKVIEHALRINPEYDQTQFTAKNGARRVFASGPEGRTVRSLNVSIDHLSTLEEAAKALNNGNIPVLNKIVNTIREKTGSPVTTNFDSIKQVVSAEIAKAVVGGQTALHDREDMAQRARNSQSPAQLMGIFGEFKKLMAGQMKGLRRQYESQTKLKDFDSMLEPETQRVLEEVTSAHGGGDRATGAVPPAAEREVGKTYPTPKGDLRWTGSGWAQP